MMTSGKVQSRSTERGGQEADQNYLVDKKLAQIRQALRGETVMEAASKNSYDDYLNLFQHKYQDF